MAKKISEEFLVEKLMTFVNEHGRPPTAREFGHHGPIKRQFGSFFVFLHSQGFTSKIGKAELAEKLHSFVEANKRTPTMNEFGHIRLIYKYYDSYFEFIRANHYEDLYFAAHGHKAGKSTSKDSEDPIVKEFLMSQIHQFVEEHGRIPRLKELEHWHLIYRYFGSYFKFIRASGYEALYLSRHSRKTVKRPAEKSEVSYTKELLIKELKSFVKEHGRTPKINELSHVSQIYKYYGSYYEFIKANGYESLYINSQILKTRNRLLENFKDTLEKEALINRLHDFVKKHRRTPKMKELEKSHQIYKYYDSYFDFISANGYEQLHISIRSQKKKRTASEKIDESFTKDFLINQLRSFVKKKGRTPSLDEFGHFDQINKYFESYDTFLQSQGFLTNSPAENTSLSEHELARKLKTFVLITERTPSSSEFGHEQHIEKLYGTFDEFLQENGFEPLTAES